MKRVLCLLVCIVLFPSFAYAANYTYKDEYIILDLDKNWSFDSISEEDNERMIYLKNNNKTIMIQQKIVDSVDKSSFDLFSSFVFNAWYNATFEGYEDEVIVNDTIIASGKTYPFIIWEMRENIYIAISYVISNGAMSVFLYHDEDDQSIKGYKKAMIDILESCSTR